MLRETEITISTYINAKMSNLEVLSIAELEAAAMEKMDKMTREYYNSGSDREITLVALPVD